MGLVQLHFRGRSDGGPLNSGSFEHPVDANWTQAADRTFRVRFEVAEDSGVTAVVSGALEANVNGGSWFLVSPTSGTVTAAVSDRFADGTLTTDVITGSQLGFVAGSGSTRGSAIAVALTDSHTELEFALRIRANDLDAGGTVGVRLAGMDAYEQTPVIYAVSLSPRERVRLKVGDTDTNDRLLSDGEIDVYVAAWPTNIELAAADAAEAIAAKFSRGFNFSTDGQVFNRRERVAHYMALSRELRSRGGAFEWPAC